MKINRQAVRAINSWYYSSNRCRPAPRKGYDGGKWVYHPTKGWRTT